MRTRLPFAARSALAALSAIALAAGSAVSAQAATPLPVTYNWTTGFLGNLPNADKAPAGAITVDAHGRLASCSSPGRLPLILVHGSWESEGTNWAAAAPLLHNAGFCVYTFNYGGNPHDVMNGYGPIATSAGQLGAFVDKVRAATGSTQVDLIGHSQGGMMPRYYIKFGHSYTGDSFGAGTSKIRRLVALAPSNHGTTLSGIADLGKVLGLLPAFAVSQPAAIDQTIGSAFMNKLDTCPNGLPSADICAGDQVQYSVLETDGDQIVTPYTNAFLKPNPAAKGSLTNITVQSGCALDRSEHLALTYDSYAYGLVLTELGIADPSSVPGARPSCKFIAPYVGG
jgi:pimeloyl-ACP methyl ester carboxylesterase